MADVQFFIVFNNKGLGKRLLRTGKSERISFMDWREDSPWRTKASERKFGNKISLTIGFKGCAVILREAKDLRLITIALT